MMEYVFYGVGIVVVGLIWAALQRRFAPHTIINGYMDLEKAQDICPEVFGKDEKGDMPNDQETCSDSVAQE
jgi:hypothetical protein